VIGSILMASTTHVALCAAIATLFWTGFGLLMTRRFMPPALALPTGSAVGWAVHSAIALPVFFLVPFAAASIAAVAAAVVAVVLLAARGERTRDGAPPQAHVPLWAYAAAALLAMAPAAAVLPKFAGDAVFLADPIFDHAKVALIDDMARLGLPPGNPFFADGSSRFVYYYLWHFSAAQFAALLGVSGWEADAAITWFSAFASLAAMMGFAAWLSRRAWAAGIVVVLAATASARFLPWYMFGAESVDTVLSRPAGFAGWLFQASWVPQHIMSATCVVVAVGLIGQLASRRNALTVAVLGLLAAAGFESSTWIGGFTFAAAALVAVPVLLVQAGKKQAWPFLGALAAAGLIALGFAAPFLHDQIVVTAARGTGSPISLTPYEVLGEAFPVALRRILDLPAFWLIFLTLELPAIYVPGAVALGTLVASRGLDPERKRGVLAFAALTIASLLIAWLLASTLSDNNDLGWRAVLPGVMTLTIFAAVGLARWIAARAYVAVVAVIAAILVGLPGSVALIHGDVAGRTEPGGRLFAQTPELWEAVRRHAGGEDRIANNPLFLEHMTLWPVDISWALLADRRSCYAGRELTLVYTSLPRPRQEAIDAQFVRVFAGTGSPQDIEDLATRYDCRVVVLTSGDGAWGDDPFAASPRFRRVEEKPGEWRIYRVMEASGADVKSR
jgi:hypothetical protein